MQLPDFAAWLRYTMRKHRLALMFILVSLMVSLFLVVRLPIWVDEAYSLGTTRAGVLTALRRAIYFELQAPFYFVVLALWRQINSSVLFSRLLSLFSVAASLLLLIPLARRYAPKVASHWIVGSVAFSPFVIYAATDIRLYGLAALLAGLMLLLFYDAFLSSEPRYANLARIVYVLVCTIAMYTQYYFGFLLVAQFICLLAFGKGLQIRQYLVALCWISVLTLPLLFIVPVQLESVAPSDVSGSSPSLFWSFRHVLTNAANYVLPDPRHSLLTTRLVRYGALLIAMIILWRTRRKLSRSTRYVLLLFIAMVLQYTLAIFLVTGGSFMGQQHTVAMYFPTMLVFWALLSHLGKYSRQLMVLSLGVILLFQAIALFDRFGDLTKRGDLHLVSRMIDVSQVEHEPIVVFPPQLAAALQYHWDRSESLRPVPGPVAFDEFHAEYALRHERLDTDRIKTELRRVLGNASAVWLVTDPINEDRLLQYHGFAFEDFLRDYELQLVSQEQTSKHPYFHTVIRRFDRN